MFDVIFAGGLSPLTVTLVVLVVGIPVLLILMVSTMPKNNKGNSGFQSRRDISKEARWSLIQNVLRVYDGFRLDAIRNLTSEAMFLTASCTCKILQHVGVRKVVEIQPDPQRETAAALPFAWSDGKNDLSVDLAYCRYAERYLDSATDKVLYEKVYPKAMLTLNALKAAHADDGAVPKFCTQCGAPISLSGDFYHCEHCGAHYQSDAYEWTMTGIQVQNEKRAAR